MRKPKSPQATVVPLTEPPVAHLGRPFFIFFVRSSAGSSHDPSFRAVTENARALLVPNGTACEGLPVSLGELLRTYLEAVREEMARHWKALASLKVESTFMFVFGPGSWHLPK
jgi:hypothetical protein